MAGGNEHVHGNDLAHLATIAPGLPIGAPRREEVLSCHALAITRNEDGYIDPVSGFFVMTSKYHLDGGSCCENQCRHCPYRES